MTAFSRKQDLIDTQNHLIKRNKTMAKSACNPDFNIKHVDWVRDAADNKYTLLEKSIKDECKKYNEKIIQRREKLGRRIK